MGKKENILKLLIEFDGLTYKRIIELYNERFKPDLIKSNAGYMYLQRLRKKGLIIHESKYDAKGKQYIYKPTAKALASISEDIIFNAFIQYSKLFHLIEQHFRNRTSLGVNELVNFIQASITNTEIIDKIEEIIK